jgi:hypothetical protein
MSLKGGLSEGWKLAMGEGEVLGMNMTKAHLLRKNMGVVKSLTEGLSLIKVYCKYL